MKEERHLYREESPWGDFSNEDQTVMDDGCRFMMQPSVSGVAIAYYNLRVVFESVGILNELKLILFIHCNR